MKCREVTELLSEYLDDDLNNEDKNAVKMHLSKCDTCRNELEYLTKYKNVFASLEQVKAPEDFLFKVHKRLNHPQAPMHFIKKLFIPFKVKIPIQAAGIILTTVIIIFLFIPSGQKDIPVMHETGFDEHEEAVNFIGNKNNKSASISRKKRKSIPAEKKGVIFQTRKESTPLQTEEKKDRGKTEIETYELALRIKPGVKKTLMEEPDMSLSDRDTQPVSKKQKISEDKNIYYANRAGKASRYKMTEKQFDSKTKSIKKAASGASIDDERSLTQIDKENKLITEIRKIVLKDLMAILLKKTSLQIAVILIL